MSLEIPKELERKAWEFPHFFFMKKRNLKIRNPRKYVRYHDFVIKSVGTNFKLK
uniref:Uncharacterized protein n=2 Tax=Leptospira santarosai TaxID=28183 RepID=M6JNZ3_9LEPT|nr:hypothetical protein LEP1GSC063_4296 [Leptospira santarosai serovar Arenal str. MAVJ 401]